MEPKLKKTQTFKPYEQRVRKKFSTYALMLFFAIGSISILFLTLTLTYFFSKDVGGEAPKLIIPPIFYVDTLILAIGSYAIIMAARSFDRDKETAHKVWLYVTIASGVAFLIGQTMGWFILQKIGFGMTVHRSSAFLYVISGIHALHIIGGVAYVVYLFLEASRKLRDPVLSIVYFTDPVPREKLTLANYYWHFMGLLWLYLLVFFMIVR